MMSDEPLKDVPPERSRGGRWVPIGDERYRIPPLAFRAVQELQEEVVSLGSMGSRPTPAQMNTVAKIVHAAMARNYPSLKIEDVDEMLDLGNYQEVLSAVLSIGGFTKESAGPGESTASAGTPLTSP